MKKEFNMFKKVTIQIILIVFLSFITINATPSLATTLSLLKAKLLSLAKDLNIFEKKENVKKTTDTITVIFKHYDSEKNKESLEINIEPKEIEAKKTLDYFTLKDISEKVFFNKSNQMIPDGFNITEIRNLAAWTDLENINIDSVSSIKFIDFTSCSHIINLSIRDCPNILPKELNLSSFKNLKTLSLETQMSENLETIILTGCTKLEEFTCKGYRNKPIKIVGLTGENCTKNLKKFVINSTKITTLDVSCLKKLETLDTSFCLELTSITGLNNCVDLKEINVYMCEKLSQKIDISNIKHLEKFFFGSSKITLNGFINKTFKELTTNNTYDTIESNGNYQIGEKK